MATRPAARRLTQAHRVAQVRVASNTITSMRASWRLLDPDDLDGSFGDWAAVAIPTIDANRQTSAQIAANYATSFKAIELGRSATVTPVLAAPAPRRAVVTSLLVTGPLSIKRAMTRGINLDTARRTAEGAAAAAAMRWALDGGRETIRLTVAKDPDARGWVRVASGNACDFCSGLDGLVFKTDSADFEAHDGCSCTAEPVYG